MSKMTQSKHQYYVDGTETGKPSITIDLKRLDAKVIDKWPPDKKKEALAWLEKYAEMSMKMFAAELRHLLKPPNHAH